MRQQFYNEEDESFLGDEELEEGYVSPTNPRQEGGEERPARPTLGERRLSRELEAGFRDDSDEESDANNKASRTTRAEQRA